MNDTLRPNEFLFINQMLTSLSGDYMLVLQSDSNLVLYGKVRHQDGVASLEQLWATGTSNLDAFYAVMQEDGNFVLRDPENGILWQTETARPGSFLQLLDDGRLVISDVTPIWAAGLGEAGEEVEEEDDIDTDIDDNSEADLFEEVAEESEVY